MQHLQKLGLTITYHDLPNKALPKYTLTNYNGAWVTYEPWFTGSQTLGEPWVLGEP